MKKLLTCLTIAALTASSAWADEALIRKTIAQRLPDFPKPDEISKTAMPGIWEVRIGGCEVGHTALDEVMHARGQTRTAPELRQFHLHVVQQRMARRRFGGRHEAGEDRVVGPVGHGRR